jgi:ubiquinone/menaquinone biosynthesis C-methylase UbiE
MTDEHWNIPIIVLLPPDFDGESLTANFDGVLLKRLGFFDRVVAPDPALWDDLRRKYRWAQSQRFPATGDQPDEIVKSVCALWARESTSPTFPEAAHIDGDPCLNKALHHVQAAALEPRFAAARAKRDSKVLLDVLQVGAGTGRWAPSFDPRKTRFIGIDAREELVETARVNFPDQRYDYLGSDLLFPYEDESFDLVFSVTAMHRHPEPAKQMLLSEMWRVARPGGRLLFLENFVFTGEHQEPAIHPTSVEEFVDLILAATAGQVVLEHVESLRYPNEDLRRGGLISLLRLGVAKKR